MTFRKRFVTLAEERWGPPAGKGYGAKDYPGIDAITFLQVPEPVPGALETRSTHTLVVDLATDEDKLFAACHATTRKGINRATREDRLEYRHWRDPSAELIDEFRAFYSRFAENRGIGRINPVNLRLYAQAGMLDVSVVRAPDGQALTWHSHLVDKNRVRQLHFASSLASSDKEFRYRVGRSNRFHHWHDIVRFKREGLAHYDFGGLYTGTTDAKGLHINEFKLSFGGTPATTYNCDLALTFKGWAYLKLRYLRSRLSPGQGLG